MGVVGVAVVGVAVVLRATLEGVSLIVCSTSSSDKDSKLLSSLERDGEGCNDSDGDANDAFKFCIRPLKTELKSVGGGAVRAIILRF